MSRPAPGVEIYAPASGSNGCGLDGAAWTGRWGRGGVDEAAWTRRRGQDDLESAAWTRRRGRDGPDKVAWMKRPGGDGVDEAAWTRRHERGAVDGAAVSPPPGPERRSSIFIWRDGGSVQGIEFFRPHAVTSPDPTPFEFIL
ncbi:uncharacterized protein V6R79_011090 [Siganus canaliculatus]